MTSNNHQGPAGPNNSDLPEFDPDEVDAFTKAIAVINKGEALEELILDAARRGDIILIPENVPLDSELISAVHRLSPGTTLTQVRKELCDYMNPLILQNLRRFNAQSFVSKRTEQPPSQDELRREEIEQKREQRMFYLMTSSLSLFAIAGAFLFFVSGLAISKSIFFPTSGSNTPDPQELRNLPE